MIDYYMERLQDIRKYKKVSQKEIADFLGIAQNQYSRYERSVNKMPFDLYIKASIYLNVSLDELCGNKKILF